VGYTGNMNTNKTRVALLFSDATFGTHEYGFITRWPGMDPDDEDRLYQRHLRKMGVDARVFDGTVKVMGEDQTGRV
jgi:hypothetical protein